MNKSQLSKKRHPLSEETKKKISEARKREWASGTRKVSPLLSIKLTGRKLPEEVRQKIREALKGNKNSLGHKQTEEHKKKISETAKRLGIGKWLIGLPITDEKRRKISEANSREKSHWWKGGITPLNKFLRNTVEYKIWRDSVFKRDNYTCVWCGVRSQKGLKVYLNADHIHLFSEKPELRFKLENGRTLCRECHYLRHSKKYVSQ